MEKEIRMERNVEQSVNSYTLTTLTEAPFFSRKQYLKEFW